MTNARIARKFSDSLHFAAEPQHPSGGCPGKSNRHRSSAMGEIASHFHLVVMAAVAFAIHAVATR
jgi:hypothetical protein